MSNVTNVLVAIGVDNWDRDDIPFAMERMNTILKNETGQILTCIDNCVGGDKNMEIPVFAAAFNYVPSSVIINAAVNADWSNPEQVQLMICEQDDYIFTVKTVEEWKKG